MKSPRIFITGVAGFLGSHIAQWALSEGYEVLGADNLSLSYKENIPKAVQFYEYDLLDLEKNKKYFKGSDLLIHTAAYPYDNFSFFAPFKVCQNTFAVTASVLSASIFNEIPRFVYFSSLSRYGNQKVPFREDMPPKALSPYAIAKVAGENLTQSLSKVHGFEYVIAIPHNIFGLQQIYNDPYRNAVSLIANQMLNNRSPVIYGDGSQVRAFSPIQDLLPVFPQLFFSSVVKNQIINIGPDEEPLSLNELVRLLNHIMGKNIKATYKDLRKQEVLKAFCCAKKSRQLLNYKKQFPLEQALRELVDHIKNKGPAKFCYHQKAEIKNQAFPESWKNKLL